MLFVRGFFTFFLALTTDPSSPITFVCTMELFMITYSSTFTLCFELFSALDGPCFAMSFYCTHLPRSHTFIPFVVDLFHLIAHDDHSQLLFHNKIVLLQKLCFPFALGAVSSALELLYLIHLASEILRPFEVFHILHGHVHRSFLLCFVPDGRKAELLHLFLSLSFNDFVLIKFHHFLMFRLVDYKSCLR